MGRWIDGCVGGYVRDCIASQVHPHNTASQYVYVCIWQRVQDQTAIFVWWLQLVPESRTTNNQLGCY